MLNRLGDEEKIPDGGGHRYRNWSFISHEVVLISNDASLASMVQTVIPIPGTLRILRAGTQLPPKHEFAAETVVLDLPADIRLAARAEVRKRYSGRLLVALSSEDEAAGWPDDPACRFLVRPFRVDEVGGALRAPVPVPDAAETPETAAPNGDGGPNTTHDPATTLTPAPDRQAGRERGSRRRLAASLLVVVMGAAAAFGGVAIGRASVKLESRPASSNAATQI